MRRSDARPERLAGVPEPLPGYEQPLVVPQDPQTKQDPAGCIEMPHV
jgi:hypothetical protein